MKARASTGPVVAAGGLVRRADGRVALVHRPRYDDWSLPKGKAEPGEAPEATALREVAEETGIRCRLGPELDTVTYRDASGRDKVVRYWLMEPVDDTGLGPDDEVDELRWCTPAEAGTLLTYAHDRRLVASTPAVDARQSDGEHADDRSDGNGNGEDDT